MIKQSANALHAMLARAPSCLGSGYIGSLSRISRSLFPKWISTRVGNSIGGHRHPWPNMKFSSRDVVVGARTKIRLVPHLGEFDEAALWSRRLGYEDAAFLWLESNTADRYDIIVEIGANVGVFTVFFNALVQNRSRLKRVIAFEPSREAYNRLIVNLEANGATSVEPFNAAVGEVSGFQTFYEPDGHLTNGSFLPEFSKIFSKTVRSHTVLVVAAGELARFISEGQRALIKIDVEGFEPQLLAAMSALIKQHRPDLLIEVLAGTAEPLDNLDVLAGYTRSLVTSDGLKPSAKLHASAIDRDWLLTWPE